MISNAGTRHKNPARKLRIYVDTPYLFVRPRNTDWRYMHMLCKLETFCSVEMVYPFDILDISRQSLSYVGDRLGFPRRLRPNLEKRTLCSRRLRRLGIDVVINHGIPPIIDGGLTPLVWQYAIIDPVMQRHFGTTDKQIESQIEFFRRMLPRATLVQVSTEVERGRHAETFLDAASKFINAPFFLPYISPLNQDNIRKKQSVRKDIEVLFVGREGRRKGLDIVASAVASMDPKLRRMFRLTVVSQEIGQDWFKDVRANILAAASHVEIRKLMNRSHIFVMPSRQESFGFAFLEAMAAGCAVIAPDWEVQREITNYGVAGFCVRPESEAIREVLTRVILDSDMRTRFALAGNEQFIEHFSPQAVACQYMTMFETAMSHKEGAKFVRTASAP